MSVGVFSSICEEDSYWLDQYLAEMERLDLQFAINFDRCSEQTKRQVIRHRLCFGYTSQDNPAVEFKETDKQGVFDLLAAMLVDWAMAWDVDEVWERDAVNILGALDSLDADYAQCYWLNLWNDKNHARVDGAFGLKPRVKFYNLRRDIEWRFNHPITNGLMAKNKEGPRLATLDLVCLHCGLMTKELRLLHKARWDRIYTAAVGANPYHFWDEACDESIPPKVIKHGYF